MHDLEATANTVAAEKIALEERLQEMEQRLNREKAERQNMEKQHHLFTEQTVQEMIQNQEAMALAMEMADDWKVCTDRNAVL